MDEIINYSPANYKAIKDSAKEMSKQELEKEYVSYRNRTHLPIGILILIILMGCGILGMFFYLGMETIEGKIVKELSENIETIEMNICQYFPEGYKINNLGGTSLDLVCEKQGIIQVECLD